MRLGKKATTDANLRRAVFKACQLIENRWDDPPTAGELAKIVGISTSHFHQAFREVVGETIRQHVIRLRIERAAAFLKFSSWQVSEIGLICGFETQSSFSRRFKQHYGITPLAYRNAESTVPFLRGYMRSRPDTPLQEDPGQPLPTVSIEDWKDLSGVSLRFFGETDKVHQAWKELFAWAKGNVPDLESARFFGLWFDGWSGQDSSKYRYEALLVPASPIDDVPSAPFTLRTLPASSVAVAMARGRLAALDAAWRSFALGWLPHSGWQPASSEIGGIDEYPSDLILASTPRQLAMLAKGITLRMCLPIQKGMMSV